MNDSSHGQHERAPYNGAHEIGTTDPAERFEVTFVLKRQATEDFKHRMDAVARGDRGARISNDDFVSRYGASDADISAVRAFAQKNGMAVVQTSPARRTVVVAGTAAQFRTALGVDFKNYAHPGGTYRQRLGTVQLPTELEGVVKAVLGLDNRPQATPHFRVRRPPAASAAHAAAPVSYDPPAVAKLYDFPTGIGSGQCIALIELGGGYRPADLHTYFTQLGISPPPTVTSVSVDHATNAPTGSANGPDGEVMLDIEVAGSIAPGARIVAYFSPNTDAGFLNAITTAIHDTVNKPNVISISWGGPEANWESATMESFDDAFQSAATLGITVCVASGDNGSGDGLPSGTHVDFPASSPHALACGGTSLRARANTIASETVWDDGTQGGATGGGVSTQFARPAYQNGLHVILDKKTIPLAKRGVPDVSGDADPETGYNVIVDGTSTQIGGTSAVAPLWASLIARANSMNTSAAGFVNADLYAANPPPFQDIIDGNNGAYSAAPGWDACTGLGSPIGNAVAATLFKSAGQTAVPIHATAGKG